MTLCLAEGVHWCVANDRIVLLDLKADAYSCLPPELDRAWRRLWMSETPNAADRDALHSLTEIGVLANGPAFSHPAASHMVTHSLLDTLNDDVASFSPAAVWHQVCMAVALRTSSLFALIAEIQRRKTLAQSKDQAVSDATRHDIARFMASRRLVSRQSQCLRTSLALVAFLARRHFYPDLVIGVRMRPFAAHAWVQTGGIVLNDTVDEVAPYTPILVV